MGLFPNPGQNVYLISSPFFESLTITNQLTNKTATIRAVNFDEQEKNIYIQSAVLNGKPYTKNWIGHEFFAQGGRWNLCWGTRRARGARECRIGRRVCLRL
jgi:putative alpha-1,2-mannosidase